MVRSFKASEQFFMQLATHAWDSSLRFKIRSYTFQSNAIDQAMKIYQKVGVSKCWLKTVF